MEASENEPWGDLCVDYTLSDAHLIATMGHDGGAISERIAKLHCTEGRLFSFEKRGDGDLNQLEYHFGFAASTEPDPMASCSSRGRIIITGVHTNGLHMEIRGDGWVGYDDQGNLEGRFDSPPVIITEDDDPEDEPSHIFTEEEILAGHDFPMPPQYNRAIRRVKSWADEGH